MVQQTARKVYSCCGQYIVPTHSCDNMKIKCPRCGKVQDKPLKFPKIVIAKQI